MSAGQSSVEFSEEEQGRYDRQIRLWGVEAQQRMRTATILVVRLQGTATETIKNIVLAGIGKLIIVDGDDVKEEDLGAGFFFRDEDVGKKRTDAAKARVESLNPLVQVETISTFKVFEDEQGMDVTIRSADIVCVTDWDRNGLTRLNDACRRLNKPFYAGGTFGILGYIFCDLLDHDYISPDRSTPNEAPKNVKVTMAYSPLSSALQHKWSKLNKKQTKALNPASVFSVLAVWEYQSAHQGILPNEIEDASELQKIGDRLLRQAEVNTQTITSIPEELIQYLATTASHEFAPVCAVVGGMLAQDILKTLAAREDPLANFFVFDGNTCGGTVCRMNM